MSLNNIKLPESVIIGLYRQPLIPASEPVKRADEPENATEAVKIPKVKASPGKTDQAEKMQPEPAKTDGPQTAQQGQQSQYRFLGNNLKHIALIVHYPDEVFLPDEQLQFLTKILGAFKLNLGDVAILNHGSMAIEIEKLKKQLRPRHVILFGVDPVAIRLPIRFPEFKEQEYADVVYLLASAPHELNQETKEGKVLKSKLWVCLLKMFQT